MESSSGRSRLATDSDSNSNSDSPEFDFWRLQEPSQPKSDLLSADQLFSDGILLPLSLVALPHPDREPPSQAEPDPLSQSGSGEEKTSEEARAVAEAGPPAASKRWRDIFKKAEKQPEEECKAKSEKKKEKKKEKRRQGGSGSAELNINIWLFSRSRSAGNGGCRPRAGVARKVSSAPCSRSNSAGENKTRKWPASPSRPGVHLGRSSPVWQVRRTSFGGPNNSDPILRTTGKASSTSKDTRDGARRSKAAVGSGRVGGRAGGGEAKARALNLNVPTCIGYRQRLSCSHADNNVVVPGTGNGCNRSGGGVESVVGGGSGTSSHFNLRSLFTRKVF